MISFITYRLGPDETGVTCTIDGWKVDGQPGVFNTFGGALAAAMGQWDEYCEWHRVNKLD